MFGLHIAHDALPDPFPQFLEHHIRLVRSDVLAAVCEKRKLNLPPEIPDLPGLFQKAVFQPFARLKAAGEPYPIYDPRHRFVLARLWLVQQMNDAPLTRAYALLEFQKALFVPMQTALHENASV